jgi:hypothetical protein
MVGRSRSIHSTMVVMMSASTAAVAPALTLVEGDKIPPDFLTIAAAGCRVR